MKLNSKEARELLEKEQSNLKDNRWIDHSICVGDTDGRLAKALVDKSIYVDVDKIITFGYIHDIGKRFNEHGGVFPHAINGYNYIKKLEYDKEYAGICIKHSFLNNDIDSISNDRDETDKSNPNYNFFKKYIKMNIQKKKK